MKFIELIEEKVKANKKKKIILPESNDERILKASEYVTKNELVDIVLIGDEEQIKKYIDIDNIEIINPDTFDKDELVNELYELRKEKGLTKEDARKLIDQPMYFSIMLLKNGYADGLVAGATHTTADTLRPALQIIKSKSNIASSFMILDYDTPLLFSDCGLNINPTEEELVIIAKDSAESYKSLIEKDAIISFLSYSTKGSGKGNEKIVTASNMMKEKYPDIISDGEMQFDAAINSEVAKIKCPESKVGGKTNTFIFPDLTSANIGYKIAEQLGGIHSYGPIIQGLNKPVNDLSRGSSVDDIIGTILITTLQK